MFCMTLFTRSSRRGKTRERGEKSEQLLPGVVGKLETCIVNSFKDVCSKEERGERGAGRGGDHESGVLPGDGFGISMSAFYQEWARRRGALTEQDRNRRPMEKWLGGGERGLGLVDKQKGRSWLRVGTVHPQ